MTSPESPPPVEKLAAESVRGAETSRTEYLTRYPHLADPIQKHLAGDEAICALEGDEPPEHLFGPPSGVRRALEKLGDYRILREIRRGGMGVVHEAEQVSLRRHVAVKVLASPNLLDAKHVERFHREARAAARLHHTNIVPVF